MTPHVRGASFELACPPPTTSRTTAVREANDSTDLSRTTPMTPPPAPSDLAAPGIMGSHAPDGTRQPSSTKPLQASNLHYVLHVARLRYRQWKNNLGHVRRDSLTRIIVVLFGLLNVFLLGFAVSYKSFRFIEEFEAFGVALNSRMISLLFFALFALVVLSTIIVTYATLFLAKETSFFYEHPLPPRSILTIKLTESIAFSSWATLFLGYPVLVSFGALRGAGFVYYFEAAAILVLFLAFAGLTGAFFSILLAPVIRRLSLRQIALFCLLAFVAVCHAFLKSFNFGDVGEQDQLLLLDRFTSSLLIIHSPYFPSYWASAGVLSAAAGNHQESLIHTATLLANTLIFLPFIAWYGNRFYGTSWLVGRSLPFARKRRAKGEPAAAQISTVVRAFNRRRLSALLLKDMLVFLRDPAQLSQSVLFFLLMAIYSLSLLRVPTFFSTPVLQKILFFANLTALCMILSSFTSRFLFPLISLEGRAFWIVGLAPMRRSALLIQKAVFGLAITLAVGIPMTIVSNLALNMPFEMVLSAVYIVTLVGLCLTALAIGLGAAYPNFAEDNPSRIAVGVGGTLNFFASALSVAVIITIIALPHLIPRLASEEPMLGSMPPPSTIAVFAAHAGATVAAAVLSLFCYHFGSRHLEGYEF